MTRRKEKLELGICKRCNRLRPIYQKTKQLCGSCRQLEALYNNPEKYKRYLEKGREKYWKNRDKKRVYNHKYYRTGNHAEKMKAYGRAYAKKNYEKYKELNKKWRKEHPEIVRVRQRRHYRKYKEKILARGREWRHKNKDRVQARQKAWLKTPQGLAWKKRYYEKNKEKFRKYRKEYTSRPDVKARLKEYQSRPDIRARAKAYRNSLEFKKAKSDYDKQYTFIRRLKQLERKMKK